MGYNDEDKAGWSERRLCGEIGSKGYPRKKESAPVRQSNCDKIIL